MKTTAQPVQSKTVKKGPMVTKMSIGGKKRLPSPSETESDEQTSESEEEEVVIKKPVVSKHIESTYKPGLPVKKKMFVSSDMYNTESHGAGSPRIDSDPRYKDGKAKKKSPISTRSIVSNTKKSGNGFE